MRKCLVGVLCILCFFVSALFAQDNGDSAPVAAPEYGMPISLVQAKQLAESVMAQASRDGEDDMTIAVVHPSGDLIYFEKMDKAYYLSIDLAQRKAIMAARYRMPSGNLPPNGDTLPDAISLKGGLPIVFQGKTIGAIGVSGAEAGDVEYGQKAIDELNASAK